MTPAEKQQLIAALLMFIAACGGLLAALRLLRAWRGRGNG